MKTASEDVVHPQTAVVTAQCPGHGIVRTSDVRVSQRTPLMQVRQKFFGPIYNELAEDVSACAVLVCVCCFEVLCLHNSGIVQPQRT